LATVAFPYKHWRHHVASKQLAASNTFAINQTISLDEKILLSLEVTLELDKQLLLQCGFKFIQVCVFSYP